MAKVKVDPDALDPKPVPDGWYDAVIDDISEDEVPETQKPSQMAMPGDPQWNWRFRIEDGSVDMELQGRALWERTNLAPGRGRQFKKFLYGLEFTDEDMREGIDSNDLVGLAVKILVVERAGKPDPSTGNVRIFNNVLEVARREF